jgi:hypothetical protein
MRLILIALLALGSGAALAAPSLTAPATAETGSTITIEVVGTGNPRDFVTVMPKGSAEGSYKTYEYARAATVKLLMPATAGDYEVRLCAADSPYKTILSRPIKLTAAKATVSSSTSVAAGGILEVRWTGPANERDYIAIGETSAGGRPYLDYRYARDGSPAKLQIPEKPGNYEVRYFLGAGDTIIARQPLTVAAVTASLTAPAQVAAGTKFKVTWTGPDNPQDFVTLVKAGTPEKTYQGFEYTSKGNTLELVAPDAAGSYELRYCTGKGYLTLARIPVVVGGSTATLAAPSQVAAGAKFTVTWTGPGNDRDFVTLVKAGAPEKTYERFEYTSRGKTLELTAPDVAGDYELRYSTGRDYLTLARAPVVVAAVTGTVAGPAQVVAGETFKVTWKGPDNPRNYVTIVAKAAREGIYSASYFYTTPKNNPGNLLAPLAPGDYELRFSTAEKYLTLARAPITVTPAKNEPGRLGVTMSAPDKSGAIEIILDASGSMLQKLGGQRRIDIARQTLTKLTSSTIPAGTPFAFRVFGREVDSCQTDLDVPVAPLNPAAVGQRIAALVAKNGAKTPIGASLDKVADDLKSVTGEKLVVLVTDGEETCGGDPAAAIERLRKAGVGTRVSIVGFALDDEKLATTFRRWSDAGGGAFFDAKDAAGLDRSLTEAMRPGFEVVNAQGQVLASGIVGAQPVQVPAGSHTVRLKGRANATKPAVVKPGETTSVAF